IERPPQLSAASLNRRTNLCSGSTEFASDRQESREVGPPLQRNEGRGEKRGKWTRFRTIEQLTSRHQGLAGESLLQEAFDHLGLVELVAAGDQHQELLRHARRLAGGRPDGRSSMARRAAASQAARSSGQSAGAASPPRPGSWRPSLARGEAALT